MNRDTLKGQWMQLKGKIRQQWGKLTDDEVDQLQGNAEVLIGKIQERYGYERAKAEQEVDRWLSEQERVRKAS
jgi:uncharacterized protein YjbJ (UPF0337 family)